MNVLGAWEVWRGRERVEGVHQLVGNVQACEKRPKSLSIFNMVKDSFTAM